MKWMSTPSIVVTNCGSAFSRFRTAPIVVGRPILGELLHRRELHALGGVRAPFPARPLRRRDTRRGGRPAPRRTHGTGTGGWTVSAGRAASLAAAPSACATIAVGVEGLAYEEIGRPAATISVEEAIKRFVRVISSRHFSNNAALELTRSRGRASRCAGGRHREKFGSNSLGTGARPPGGRAGSVVRGRKGHGQSLPGPWHPAPRAEHAA